MTEAYKTRLKFEARDRYLTARLTALAALEVRLQYNPGGVNEDTLAACQADINEILSGEAVEGLFTELVTGRSS